MKTQAYLEQSGRTIRLGNQYYTLTAWTGGKSNYRDCKHPDYQRLRRWFFRAMLKECGGLDYWKCAGTSSMERARIFWNRASLDALATLNLN